MDEFERLDILNNDGALTWSRYLLFFAGFAYLLMACGFPFYFTGYAMPPEAGASPIIAWAVAIVCSLMFGFFAILNFAASSGLANGKKWAWVLSLVLGALYLPSCCFPFGALILFALLREKVRSVFG